MISSNLVDIIKRKANQSYCRYKVAAIGFDEDGRIVATGVNRPRLEKQGGGKHAEMVVLQKAGKRVRSMIICRVGNAGELRPIKCCSSCKKVLDKMGIKIVTLEGAI